MIRLDGTAMRVRLDHKAANISLLVALDVRRYGQKILLSVRDLGGESEAAWRNDLLARGPIIRSDAGVGRAKRPPFDASAVN